MRVLMCLLVLVAGQAAAEEMVPQWISAAETMPVKQADAFYRHSFELPQLPVAARLLTAGDGAGADLFLDGKLLSEIDPYDPLYKADVTEHFSRGKHVLAIRSRSYDPSSMIFLRLQLKFADGTTKIIATNADWQCSLNEKPSEDAGWKPAHERFPVDDRLLISDDRRIDIAATDNYEQWRQASGAKEGTDPAKFFIAPGFEIELIRSAKEGEDSWISLVFDPQGRAIISQELLGLLRMTFAKDGSVETTERINETLAEVRGMVFLGKDLYANANNDKDIYVLRGDDAGKLAFPERVLETVGGVGHGRNDLTLGPDGKIYSIHGDSVKYLDDDKDYSPPFRGFETLKSGGDGHLLRIDPKTKTVETIVAGLRNPYGIAFNKDGEAFTYDADAEFDMGTPWYRPTRVSHLTLGGDFGWRSVTGQWPPYVPDHPDNAPHSLDIGKGSPTAVMFGTNSNFPPRYRDALFILDWTYGRILVVHCLPTGSSYLCEAETFLKGRPLNVTDVSFGPDGAMYLITGGRKTQSALYRVRYRGEPVAESKPSAAQVLHDERAAESRALRRKLEAIIVQDAASKEELDFAWSQLGYPDPRIRTAARQAIERQTIDRWLNRPLPEKDRLATLSVLMELARSTVRNVEVLKHLNAIDLKDAPRGERLMAAWIYHVASDQLLLRHRDAVPTVRQRLSELYPDRDFAVNQQLSFALANVGSNDLVPKTMKLLTASQQQAEKLHYLFVLRNAKEGWTPELKESYFNMLALSRHYIGGEGMPKILKQLRDDAVAGIVSSDSQRDVFRGWLENDPPKVPEFAPRDFVRKWAVDEALEASKEVKGRTDLERGRDLFSATSCIQCHRCGKYGNPFGPDLTAAASRYSRKDLLEAIIEPSKVIAENYLSLQILTTDGKSYVGRPALGGDYRSQVLKLNADPQNPFAVTEIDKRNIEAEKPSTVSFMPEGLLNTLTVEEIRDLLAFIESGGEVPDDGKIERPPEPNGS